jgi:hypothetical protein
MAARGLGCRLARDRRGDQLHGKRPVAKKPTLHHAVATDGGGGRRFSRGRVRSAAG